MKKLLLLLFILIAVFSPFSLFAQDTTAVASKGWQIGLSADVVGWSSTDVDMEQEIGWGISGDFGYNVSENFGLQIPFSISRFNPSDGGDYNQFKYGLGAEYRFGSDQENMRLLINSSYNSIWLYQNLQTGDLNIISHGPGVGSGLLIDLSNELNLRVGYNRYWSTITTVTIGSDDYDADGGMTTGQFTIGLVRYFQ
ncbi:MAG: outer membrane beta-barrel protein [Balneolaceae bacterium]